MNASDYHNCRLEFSAAKRENEEILVQKLNGREIEFN